MEDVAIQFLKTYQVWHHRRLLLIRLKNPLPELLFISNALESDEKNYHTWAYRQWILNHFAAELGDQVWDDEINFVESMLEDDIRNNSAWHHRFFVVRHPSSSSEREEILRRELRYGASSSASQDSEKVPRYVKTKIALVPSNLSAWNYLRGILTESKTYFYTQSILNFAEPFTKSSLTPGVGRLGGAIDLDNPGPGQGAELPCAYAVEFVADALATQCAEVKESEENRKAAESRAVDCYRSLASNLDPMRKSYASFTRLQVGTYSSFEDTGTIGQLN
jgi:protein farnesyltransferase/geranylgeranyltransferase type-1 subunit alpha